VQPDLSNHVLAYSYIQAVCLC